MKKELHDDSDDFYKYSLQATSGDTDTESFTHYDIYFFQAIMDRFFERGCCRDQMSLSALKVILKSDQVSPDISKNYHAVHLFLDKVLDGYLITYAEENLTSKNDLTSDQGTSRLLFSY